MAKMDGKGQRPPLAELIGPGLIAGAADDDPSGIATYSQAGAKFGPHTVWSLVLAFPFMAAAPIMALVVHMAADHRVMGKFPISRPLVWIGWAGWL